MSVLKIQTPRVFQPLLQPSRYKGIHGGRGSGKSHFFAELLIERALLAPIRAVCIREIQKSIKQSVKLLLEDKIKRLGLESEFEILETEIRGKNGSLITFQGMQNHTADSIKSLEGYDIAWFEEAQTMSARSLELLRPTIRKEGSELWFSWNPSEDSDPVDELLRGDTRLREDVIVIEANYMDNPYFPDVLYKEMLSDKERNTEMFGHIWLGEYRPFAGGAVYGTEMHALRKDGRIAPVPYDPLCPVFTVWDLGYSKGNSTAIGFGQIVGREVRLIDYEEDTLKGIDHYLKIVKEKPYNYNVHVFPHDAGHASLRTGMTFVKQLEQMGLGRENKDLIVLPIDKIDPGIELVRALLKHIWIDERKCGRLVKCLFKYHYEYDEERNIYSKVPHHDEFSNGADMMRYFATYLATKRQASATSPYAPKPSAYTQQMGAHAWMG